MHSPTQTEYDRIHAFRRRAITRRIVCSEPVVRLLCELAFGRQDDRLESRPYQTEPLAASLTDGVR